MRIALLGGTGKTGRLFAEKALAAGNDVSALARNPATANLPDRVTIVPGGISDIASLRSLVQDKDAVVSCLGPALRKSFSRNEAVGAEGIRNTLPLMKEYGVRRLVALSALGAADSYAQVDFGFRLIMATVLSGIYRDKNQMESIICDSDIDWTIIRPSNLTDGPYTGSVDMAPKKLGLTSRISRADVAGVLLEVLGEPSTYRKAILITGND